VRSFQVIACVLLNYDKCKNATYEQWFQDDINVQFNPCTMLIVEEMPKKLLTIIVQCINKVKCYLNFQIKNFKLLYKKR